MKKLTKIASLTAVAALALPLAAMATPTCYGNESPHGGQCSTGGTMQDNFITVALTKDAGGSVAVQMDGFQYYNGSFPYTCHFQAINNTGTSGTYKLIPVTGIGSFTVKGPYEVLNADGAAHPFEIVRSGQGHGAAYFKVQFIPSGLANPYNHTYNGVSNVGTVMNINCMPAPR